VTPRDQVQQRIRGLYGIADASAGDGDPLRVLAALLAGGCRLVQLRCKDWPVDDITHAAAECVQRCRAAGATFLVNDHPAIAAAVGADGVHVGQHDAPADDVRRIVGEGRIVGRSTHSPQHLAEARLHADYVAFGPVYPTPRLSWSKPLQGIEALRAARRHAGDTPLVAIGGIDATRLAEVRSTGVDAWAVIGAVALAADPVAATRALC